MEYRGSAVAVYSESGDHLLTTIVGDDLFGGLVLTQACSEMGFIPSVMALRTEPNGKGRRIQEYETISGKVYMYSIKGGEREVDLPPPILPPLIDPPPIRYSVTIKFEDLSTQTLIPPGVASYWTLLEACKGCGVDPNDYNIGECGNSTFADDQIVTLKRKQIHKVVNSIKGFCIIDVKGVKQKIHVDYAAGLLSQSALLAVCDKYNLKASDYCIEPVGEYVFHGMEYILAPK